MERPCTITIADNKWMQTESRNAIKTTMNQHERSFSIGPEAELRYSHGEYKIMRNGTFVRCAVTGHPIPLDDLKYWSVELQEPYSSPEAVLERLRKIRAPSVFGR
jgi:hypothetical protein